MNAQISCPDPVQLFRLLQGELNADQAAAIQGHLQGCAACREAIQHLPRPDSSQNPTALLDTSTSSVNTNLAALVARASAACSGEQIGHYQIQEVIGTGTIGRVHKAFDPLLRRVVALKVLTEPLAAVAAARRRFLREAQAAAAISHPNVITIHAVKEIADKPFLVMEYIPGQSLQQRLQHSQPFEMVEIVRLGMQIAAGLAAAHALGVIHRDLKPANVLLEGDTGNVKLTDFGLAQVADDASLQHSGVQIAEPAYCSPEQARADAVDARSDLFSLGSLLYHLCANHPPFRAAGGPAILQRILSDTPQSLRAINPATPRWLAAVISKLMEKDPAERYQSADEVVEELGQQLLRLEQTLPVPLPGVRINRPAGTMRRLGWRLALACLLLVAGVGVTAWLGGWLSSGKPAIQKLPPQPPIKTGWTSLFNGKDLSGWKRLPEQPGHWGVEGGNLTGRGPRRSHLFSDRGDYENFHLRVESRINENGDSGLYFRCDGNLVDGNALPSGYEAQLTGDKSSTTIKTGSLCHLVDRNTCPLATTSKWFVYEMIVEGNHLQTKLDGQTIVDYTDPGYQYTRGHLALQVFGPDTTVQFRKIEIKELPPTPVRRDPILVRRFGSADRLLSPKEVFGDGKTWRANHNGPHQTLPLFQIDNPILGPGVLRFSAQMEVHNLTEATLVMVCRFKDGRTTTFNHLWPNKTTPGWQDLNNRLYQMDSAVRPQSIGLELRVNGEGRVLFKDLELWHFPVAPPEQRVVPSAGAGVRVASAGMLTGNTGIICTLLAGPDGKTLFAGGQSWSAWQRDDKGWRRERSISQQGTSMAAALAPDGQTVLAGTLGPRIEVFQRTGADWQPGTAITIIGTSVQALAIRPTDGHLLASLNGDKGEVQLFDWATRKELPSLDLGTLSEFTCAAFSPDGRTLALGARNGQLVLCSVESRQVETTLKTVPVGIHCLAYSPDGQALAAGRADGKITLYRRAGDGWQEQTTLDHGGLVRALAFRAGGKLLASAGDNRTAVLWDAASGQKQAVLEGHLERIQALAFTLDGRTLATGGAEGYIGLWAIGE